ncbi:MAG: HlyD family type I secretion periplasmic adaptor subunit [Pseudomonadota bacterium]
MKLIDKKALASDVITHDVSPLTVNTDAGAYAKLGWWIVLLGVGGFLLWAVLAPLDKGVPLSGSVAKESNRKAIQYLNGGTVDEILVKEGQSVKAGQILVRVNAVQAHSQQEITRIQYFAANASVARLTAERDGKSAISYPADLLAAKTDPRIAADISLQDELFASRQSALHSELAAASETVAGLRIQIEGVKLSRDSKKEQLVLMKEQVDNLRDLAKDGYIPRSKLLDLERGYLQLGNALTDDVASIGRGQRQIAELELKQVQRKQEYQREVRTQLADVKKEAEALGSRRSVEDYQVENADVKSPVDGVVVGMAVFTRGGVVQPGFRMMDVVPTDDALVVEGQVPVNLIDKVHAGLKVELIFSAFNSNSTPHIPGEVVTVSADRLLDERTGVPYYKMTAKVSAEGTKLMNAKKLNVRPGMPVELFVRTGERTMMSYLLKPLFDRAKTSLTEE